MVKGVLVGSFRIFRYIFFPFLMMVQLMLVLTVLLMAFCREYGAGQEYFGSFYRSLLTSF